jgi:uncharacterized membrane protein
MDATMIKKISKLFLQGLMAILPVALTIYVLYWLAVSAESILGKAIRLVLPENFYLPGMGVLASFLVILALGILLKLWLFRKIFQWGEKIIEKVPFVKFFYSAIRDLTSLFDSSKNKEFNKVVMVTLIEDDIKIMGLVTREDFEGLPETIYKDDKVAVFLPWSYQMGGLTIMVSKSKLEPIELSVDQALRFMLTAGVSTESEKANIPRKKKNVDS